MIKSARNNFVLFPTSPVDLIEDSAFKAPDGANRPRVYIHLRARGHSSLGYLRVELFTDACPLTCGLFLELMMGDGLGHGYVGTRFFRYLKPSLNSAL
ncbi:peptidyl-prolyl cis-trans isomerase E [Danaus plexippus plexippus]|uniref:Peptidyl-prolyl cis-trans isomerase E n=1 Tax=Danaus plexippus plexippus TaxID=278856 RepID=A0A212F549_DANPL|nr:peptidyl-prolyl cis-trans isomerase E [Danaus plexippus plexippus]